MQKESLEAAVNVADDELQQAEQLCAADPQTEGANNGRVLDATQSYDFLTQLGEGGMGLVYKVRDRTTGQIFALKKLRPELVRDPSIVDRFYREGIAAQRLSHKNVATVYSCGHLAGPDGTKAPYIVMDFIDGVTLAGLIASESAVPVERAVNLFQQICDALIEAHRLGIVHRDIKPSNILIGKDDSGNDLVKLVDLGIAKANSLDPPMNPSLTHTGSILGSPAYMSPEQCMGTHVDERTDVYSLGCLMYETLTGRNPFAADSPVKTIIKHIEEQPEPFAIEFKHLKIPQALENVVMTCLAKEPGRRYQTVSLLKEAMIKPAPPPKFTRSLATILDLLLVVCIPSLIGVPRTLAYLFIPIYFAAFESSAWCATPGQRFFGLQVWHGNRQRFSLADSLLYWGTLFNAYMVLPDLVAWVLCVPFYSFDIPKSLCDNAEYVVVLFVWAINTIVTLLTGDKQQVFDRLFGRFVGRAVALEKKSYRRASSNWKLAAALFVAVLPGITGYVLPRQAADLYNTLASHVQGFEPVIVAAHYLPDGTLLDRSMLDKLYALHPPGRQGRERPEADMKRLLGRKLARTCYYHDQVGESDLEPPRAVLEKLFGTSNYVRINLSEPVENYPATEEEEDENSKEDPAVED